MKISLSFVFPLLLLVALPLRAQQATPAASKPSTPVSKRSAAVGGRPSSSTPAPLAMPVEAKPATPASARPVTSEAPKARATNWEVYPVDHMPAGKSVTEAEAAKLAAGDYSEKVLYLVGRFFVSVVQKDRAVLWPGDKVGPIHLVVSYPLSIPPPAEGTWVDREAPRGFRITRIKHTGEGEVTIYVRDITVP